MAMGQSLMKAYFFNQELIPYCYLFCYPSCWGGPLQKSPKLSFQIQSVSNLAGLFFN